jgi:hypothetical protein
VSWDAPNDGSKWLGLPLNKTEQPVVLSQSTLEPCTGASKSERQDLHMHTTSGDRGHKGVSMTVRLRFDKSAEGGTTTYGLDRREPTGVHDARDYSTIVGIRTKTG